MNTKLLLTGVLLLSLLVSGLWLLTRPSTDLHGTWASPQYYLIFTSPAEGDVYVQSRDCTGWPLHQAGNDTLRVRVTAEEMVFPPLQTRQAYRLVGGRQGLVISAAGPLPQGSYQYTSDNTFALVGICGLQP